MSRRKNPFACAIPGHPDLMYTDAQSRLDCVGNFTRQKCTAALLIPGLQKAVLDAIHRRLRKLAREAAKR